MEPDQDVSGQFWRFGSNGDGTFCLSTLFRGPGMCLDVFNGGPNNNQPHLVKCANFTGQFWNILATEGGDQIRLTTKFRGPGMSLDIFNSGANDNQPHLVRCSSATHFLMKTLPKVATEMALHVLAYNLTRVMNAILEKSIH